MSKDPYRDQAAKRKIKIERVPEETPVKKREPLPPRSELHREKHKKNKWKMKYPLISMLLLFFILLPLTVFGIYSYLDHRNGPLVVMSEDIDDVVEVRYDQSEDEQEDSEAEAAVAPQKEEDPPETDKENTTSKESASTTGEKNQQASAPPPKETVEEKPQEQIKEEPKEEPKEIEKEEPKVKIVYHTVKPQETLYRIAMNYYHSPSGVDRIKEWNKIQDTDIQTGEVLEIPLDQ